MPFTTQQMSELNKLKLKDLKTMHTSLKKQTCKTSKKEHLIVKIKELLTSFNDIKRNLSKQKGYNVKPYNTDRLNHVSAVDLRQAHQKFRKALQCGSNHSKQNIITCLSKLCKEIDFFVQYSSKITVDSNDTTE